MLDNILLEYMYRVDKRQFKIGDIITNSQYSYQDNKDFDNRIEEMLLKFKPNNNPTNRKTALYLFQDLSDAILFSSKMINSKIYKVSTLIDTNFCHRGDMNWTDLLKTFIHDENICKEISEKYWNNEKTPKPCWEILLHKVQVEAIILNDENLRKNIYSDLYKTSNNIEKLTFYKQNL